MEAKTLVVCESCTDSITEEFPMPLEDAKLTAITAGYLMVDHECERILDDDEVDCRCGGHV